MSDAINMDMQSSMLLETLRQTPSIQDNNHQDSGGGGSAGDGNAKSTSSSSLSSSADGGGGGVGMSSDGSTSDKNALEAMDPAIMSTSAPSGSNSPVSGSGGSEKSNRTRYSVNQLLALRNMELSKKKPAFMVEPRSEKLARMFINLDRGTDRYGKSLSSMGKTSEAPYEDENGGGNGPSGGNYGRNRVANGSNGGNTDGSSGGRMDMRRSGGMDLRDPKDRLRKEDGIVLSPQRRSFNMGCQMPAAPSANASGLNIGGGLLRNERDLLGGRERRIGSGRILSRDVSWDYRPDKDAPESNDFRVSGNANFRERERDLRDSRETRDTRDARDSRDSRDPRDSRDRNDRDKDFRKDYDRDRERDRDREERFERRSVNRDYDRNEKDSRNSRMSSRYSNAYNSNNDSHGGGNNYHSNSYNHYHSSHHDRRRLYSDHGRDEEPEWFSEPTSQTDTIELRGFDDPVSEEETKSDKEDSRGDDSKHDLLEATKQTDKEVKRPSSSSALQNDKNNNADASSDGLLLGAAKNDQTNANQLLTTPTSPSAAQMNRTPGDGASESSGKSAMTTTLGGITNTLGPSKITDDDFNFEDFLKLDALPSSLLYPDLPASKDTGSTGGSRFSQWFKPDNTSQAQPSQQSGLNQPQQQPKQPSSSHFVDSRRSSLQDEINNMINDFTSTGLDDQLSDSNSNKYFAPISPAASTSSNSLLELFQRGDKQQQHQQQHQQPPHQQQQPLHRDREHHPQQQLQPQQQPNHPHGHPLLGHPPNHPGLHHQQQHHQQIQNRNLQQLLGVSGSGNHGPHGPIPPASSGGQIHNVEELEARMRQNDSDGNTRTSGTMPSIPRLITPSSAGGGGSGAVGGGGGGGAGPGHLSNDAQQQEMNAFKKLLAQISENQPPNPQPTPTAAHPPHHQSLPINILHHQQQHQNDLLQKMLHLNQMHHPVNDGRQAEILKRPEAQALLHSVARGEVSQHNLWQQLTSPATAQPHREILTSVLSTINTSPRVVSPNILIQPSPGGVPILPPATVPPAAAALSAAAAANSANLLFQHHSKQQMRLSPLPNGMPQRIPSPRELQYHTQSIMQNALIRKKLEEQRENYRKRQEQQQQQQQNRNQPEASSASASTVPSTTISATTSGASSVSTASSANQPTGNQPTNSIASSAPATAVAPASAVATPVVASSIASPVKQTPPAPHSHSQHTSSPTPLAFTPTSVLRKMTAEKESEPLSSNNSAINTPSSSAMPNIRPNDHLPLGAGGHNQNLLMGLNNPLNQQQQQQQRNLAALIGAHPPLQPPHSQPPGPPPQLSHHHLGGAGHHPSTMGAPQSAQPPQPNPQQMRGGHQPPGMPGGNIPWNLKQPHPGPQMPSMSKPQGRPILKGGNTQPQPPQQQQHPSPMSQMSFASNLEFQQQMQQFQGRSGNPILGAHQSQQQQQQQLLQQQQSHNQHQNQMNPHLQQLLQQRQQQQQRAIRNQHMQQMPPSFRMGPQQPQQQQSQGQHSHQGQQQPPGASGIINYNRDGGLSPTSNQLARWFSPELLAQASAGKLPSLNVGQAMSLEDFERSIQHSSATVHN